MKQAIAISFNPLFSLWRGVFLSKQMKLFNFQKLLLNADKIEGIKKDYQRITKDFVIEIRTCSRYYRESFSKVDEADARFEEILIFLTEGIWPNSD